MGKEQKNKIQTHSCLPDGGADAADVGAVRRAYHNCECD